MSCCCCDYGNKNVRRFCRLVKTYIDVFFSTVVSYIETLETLQPTSENLGIVSVP